LLHKPEFDRVYRNGRRRTSRQFIVFSAPNGLERSRFGMSIGRALGGAVVRNRIRRRLREILRRHRQEISSGWDIILHPRASVATSEFRALTEELLGLLRSVLPAPARETARETPREEL
jgi:ribonuclease P protein component